MSTEREQFEAHFLASRLLRGDDGVYLDPSTEWMWMGWNGRAQAPAQAPEPAQARNSDGETPFEHAHRWATELAAAMARKFYPEVPQWRPLPDLLGVITQIDHMVTGLVREPQPAQAEPHKTALQSLYDACQTANAKAIERLRGIVIPLGVLDEACSALTGERVVSFCGGWPNVLTDPMLSRAPTELKWDEGAEAPREAPDAVDEFITWPLARLAQINGQERVVFMPDEVRAAIRNALVSASPAAPQAVRPEPLGEDAP